MDLCHHVPRSRRDYQCRELKVADALNVDMEEAATALPPQENVVVFYEVGDDLACRIWEYTEGLTQDT